MWFFVQLYPDTIYKEAFKSMRYPPLARDRLFELFFFSHAFAIFIPVKYTKKTICCYFSKNIFDCRTFANWEEETKLNSKSQIPKTQIPNSILIAFGTKGRKEGK